MSKICLQPLTIIVIILAFALTCVPMVQSGTKDLNAGKRAKFSDDSVESMRDVFARKEEEEKVYRNTMLTNSIQTVELLKQIRDLLQQLNLKESLE